MTSIKFLRWNLFSIEFQCLLSTHSTGGIHWYQPNASYVSSTINPQNRSLGAAPYSTPYDAHPGKSHATATTIIISLSNNYIQANQL